MQIDYYTSLSRAVAGLDRDAYAARGAVYDREHKALMRRLYSADPPHSDAEIEREQHAFRTAVRRIEFADDEIEIPLVPQREQSEEPSLSAAELRIDDRAGLPTPAVVPRPDASRPPSFPPAQAEEDQGGGWPPRPPAQGPLSSDKGTPVVPDAAIENSIKPAVAAPVRAPAAAQIESTPAAVALLKRRPVAGRVVRRALLGIALLGLGAVAYDALTGELGLPFVRQAVETEVAAPPPLRGPDLTASGTQQVILFDGNRADPNAPKFAGTAIWRLQAETAPSPRNPSPVVMLNLNVPGRRIALTMIMRREPPGSAMSHLFEIRFLGDNKEPDPDIVNMAPAFMTTAEMTGSSILAGQVVSVTPGVFLFGLSGDATAREKNLRSLKDLGWLAIPIVYRNGTSGLLAVEKGADGERAINEALRQWGS
jgi:hypothetical protein